MAISTGNLSADAITQLRAELSPEVVGQNTVPGKAVTLLLGDIYFIFGLEWESKGDVDQVMLQDAYDYFASKISTWDELGNVTISWLRQKIKLFTA